jgi:hypothetical protein
MTNSVALRFQWAHNPHQILEKFEPRSRSPAAIPTTRQPPAPATVAAPASIDTVNGRDSAQAQSLESLRAGSNHNANKLANFELSQHHAGNYNSPSRSVVSHTVIAIDTQKSKVKVKFRPFGLICSTDPPLASSLEECLNSFW